MKKHLIIASTLSLILVSILSLDNTYSLFVSEDIDENANVYTTGNLNITYTLSDKNVKIDYNSPLSDADSIRVNPYRISITNTGSVSYKLNVILNDTTSNDKIDYSYIMTRVGKLDIKSLKEQTNNIIAKNIIVPANNTVDIDVRVWLSDKIPNSQIGKNFYAKLSISGIATYTEEGDIDNSYLIADRVKSGATYLEDLYNDGNKITEASISNNESKVYLNNNNKIMLDNNQEYRFFGNNPNNYISFNEELWRIIGVFKINGENRIKIIRNNYLNDTINYSNNNYAESEINKYLNNNYYKTMTTRAKSFISDVNYKLGGSSIDYYANNSYESERSEKVFSCLDNTCGGTRSIEIKAFVGLMYASDYLYATDLTKCISNGFSYNNSTCYPNDWLNKEAELTITPSFQNATDMLSINGNKIESTNLSLKIRPVVYLNSNINILSGNGTEKNPYIIDE